MQELKSVIGEKDQVLAAITDDEIRNSSALRTTLQRYKEFYFFMHDKDPKHLEKQYTSPEQKFIDDHQRLAQSNFNEDINLFEKHYDKNMTLF